MSLFSHTKLPCARSSWSFSRTRMVTLARLNGRRLCRELRLPSRESARLTPKISSRASRTDTGSAPAMTTPWGSFSNVRSSCRRHFWPASEALAVLTWSAFRERRSGQRWSPPASLVCVASSSFSSCARVGVSVLGFVQLLVIHPFCLLS